MFPYQNKMNTRNARDKLGYKDFLSQLTQTLYGRWVHFYTFLWTSLKFHHSFENLRNGKWKQCQNSWNRVFQNNVGKSLGVIENVICSRKIKKNYDFGANVSFSMLGIFHSYNITKFLYEIFRPKGPENILQILWRSLGITCLFSWLFRNRFFSSFYSQRVPSVL